MRNPALVVFAFLILLYVIRPVYILLTEEVGTPQLGFESLRQMESEYASSLLVITGGLTAFAAGFLLAPRLVPLRLVTATRTPRPASMAVIGVLLAVSVGFAAVVFRELSDYPGGWQSALTVRQQFFAGRTFLIWGMELYKIGLIAWLAATVMHGFRPTPLSLTIIFFLWVPAAVLDTLAGSRAELLLRNVVPIALVMSLSFRRTASSRVFLLGILVLAVLLFVGYRTVVRDSPLQAQLAVGEQFAANVADLPGYILAGDEAGGFDYLVAVRRELEQVAPYRGIETARALALAPLPAAWLADKPRRGGAELTELLRPSQFARGANLAFSGAADLFFTGGDGAILVGFLLIGLVFGGITRPMTKGGLDGPASAWRLCFAFITAAAVVSIFRADLYEVSFLPVRLGLLILAYLLLTDGAGDRNATLPAVRLARP